MAEVSPYPRGLLRACVPPGDCACPKIRSADPGGRTMCPSSRRGCRRASSCPVPLVGLPAQDSRTCSANGDIACCRLEAQPRGPRGPFRAMSWCHVMKGEKPRLPPTKASPSIAKAYDFREADRNSKCSFCTLGHVRYRLMRGHRGSGWQAGVRRQATRRWPWTTWVCLGPIRLEVLRASAPEG